MLSIVPAVIVSTKAVTERKGIVLRGIYSFRYFYDCGKCELWLLVYKVLFTVQERVKTKKKDEELFLPDKQRYINACFQYWTEYRKKELFNLFVDKYMNEIIGNVYCLKCENENCIYFSTNQNSENGFCD